MHCSSRGRNLVRCWTMSRRMVNGKPSWPCVTSSGSCTRTSRPAGTYVRPRWRAPTVHIVARRRANQTKPPPPKYCTPGYVICLTLNRARGVYYLGGILIGGYGISALSLSPSPSPLFVFSFVIGMHPYPDEWHPASMLMRLLDMLCVHACCTLSLPQSPLSSSELLCSGVETVSRICSCFVCLYVMKRGYTIWQNAY